MNKLIALADIGQAVWLNYIRRSFINSGKLQELIDEGLRGITFNPLIFERTIAGSSDYDTNLTELIKEDKSFDEIYDNLVLADISEVADLLENVYKATNGSDGFVSIDINPVHANDTAAIIAESRRLFSALNRTNVMIKVPSTAAGIPAVKALISEGINVNAVMIYSIVNYQEVADAYISGLEKFAENGGKVSQISSVASFFISRVDSAVDLEMEEIDENALKGKVAISNAKIAYEKFRDIFTGPKWKNLTDQGGHVQRLLWTGTGTLNTLYSNTAYVDSLIGPDTVNLMSPFTLNEFREHGTVSLALGKDIEEAHANMRHLKELGVNLNTITKRLQQDEVKTCVKSFQSIIAGIAEKRGKIRTEWNEFTANLGSYQKQVGQALNQLKDDRIITRIWAHDHTVWKLEPDKIEDRLGWLHTTEVMLENITSLEEFTNKVRIDGYTHALILGMGGSSLTPEVFRETFGVKEGYLDLSIIDSTDPDAILACAEQLDLERTLFIVSTKSGSTVETLSFYKYFYTLVASELGEENAGEHFVAITDYGSKLADEAGKRQFRKIFFNNPNIGGRYSALSYFGLVPAALIGMNLERLLRRALASALNCESCNFPVIGNNHGVMLGTIMGELARSGRDKITLIISPSVSHFGDWLEQLIAESTGKDGRGILPVVGESLAIPSVYDDDRFIVYINLDGDNRYEDGVQALERCGHPVVRLKMRDKYDLGSQIFLWEMSTVVAAHCLTVNPFDQPNVESSKELARQIVSTFQKEGRLPEDKPESLNRKTLKAFLSNIKRMDYIAIQAYVKPTERVSSALQKLQNRLRDVYSVATTKGYGPRFLHSTGQLHKGDAGNGVFIQITADTSREIPIPEKAGSSDSFMTFGILKMAQAIGDKRALLNGGRRVIRFHLDRDVCKEILQIVDMVS
jgi:transaldolase/glucose-6-phosphate isomerase